MPAAKMPDLAELAAFVVCSVLAVACVMSAPSAVILLICGAVCITSDCSVRALANVTHVTPLREYGMCEVEFAYAAPPRARAYTGTAKVACGPQAVIPVCYRYDEPSRHSTDVSRDYTPLATCNALLTGGCACLAAFVAVAVLACCCRTGKAKAGAARSHVHAHVHEEAAALCRPPPPAAAVPAPAPAGLLSQVN